MKWNRINLFKELMMDEFFELDSIKWKDLLDALNIKLDEKVLKWVIKVDLVTKRKQLI